MDIAYLLWLQDFRIAINDALTPFMEWLSLFGVTYIFILPAFIYWCVDKRKGMFTMTAFAISCMISSFVKLIACVYRPWIREPRIVPAGNSIETAGGYSFPSGHTATVTPIYGAFAIFAGNRKWLRFFWIFAILLTGFSRNYLGVHTPQDVIVGLIIGVASLYITAKFFAYLDNHPENEGKLFLFIIILSIIILIYTVYKPYPMDYDANGKLLVSPKQMQRVMWTEVGGIIALLSGLYIEKRWIKFQPLGDNSGNGKFSLSTKNVILAMIGLIILCVMIYGLKSTMTKLLGSFWGRFANQFIFVFYIVALWPLVIKLVTRRTSDK